MSTKNKRFKLRQIREEKGLSLEQVADSTGIKVPNLSMIERGLQGVSINNAAKLVEFYGRETITEMELLYPDRFPVAQAA